MYCNLLELQGSKSRVPSQNGVSQAWYIVEIHHSGRKPSKWTKQFVLSMNSFILHESKMTSQQCWWTWPVWKNENCLEGTEFSWGDGSVREYKKKRKKKDPSYSNSISSKQELQPESEQKSICEQLQNSIRQTLHAFAFTDKHTYRNKCIHTYIHTDRQWQRATDRQTWFVYLHLPKKGRLC